MLSFFRWTVYSQESRRLRHWHLRHGGRPVKVCKSANNRFKSSFFFFFFFSTNHTILSICPRCALSARSHPPSKLRSSFIPQTNSYAAQTDLSCERLFFLGLFLQGVASSEWRPHISSAWEVAVWDLVYRGKILRRARHKHVLLCKEDVRCF